MKKQIVLIIKLALGAVFIISAYAKLVAPGIVEIILVDHGLAASRETAAVYVRILIAFEFAIGLLFIQPNYLKKIVIPLATFFLGAFTAYLVYTGFILGDTQNCGCFGTAIEMSPLESIIKNVVLIVLIVILYKYSKDDKIGVTIPSILIVVSIASVFAFSPIKNSNDFKFAGYTDFIGKGRVDLSNGNKLIAILNTECDHCQDLTKKLVKMKNETDNFPELYALVFSEGDVTVDSFKTLTGFDFPYAVINAASFFDYIGSGPPRIYWLQNGIIKEYWDSDFEAEIDSNFISKN